MYNFPIFILLFTISKTKVNNMNFTSNKNLSIINTKPNNFLNSKESIPLKEQNSNNFKKNQNNDFLMEIFNKSNLNIIPLKKNLIIGTVKNHGWEEMAPFFKSFQKAGFKNCDCVIFIHNISPFTIKKLKSYGVIIYKIPTKYLKMKLTNYRWKLYSNYLENNLNRYNLVFTADIRDVIFQQDVFKFYDYKNSFLGVAIEDGNLTERMNKNWIIKDYNEELYKTIENERIICLGTIWGTFDKFKEFSDIIWKNINSESSFQKKTVDQAVANFLIYHDKIFNISYI